MCSVSWAGPPAHASLRKSPAKSASEQEAPPSWKARLPASEANMYWGCAQELAGLLCPSLRHRLLARRHGRNGAASEFGAKEIGGGRLDCQPSGVCLRVFRPAPRSHEDVPTSNRVSTASSSTGKSWALRSWDSCSGSFVWELGGGKAERHRSS